MSFLKNYPYDTYEQARKEALKLGEDVWIFEGKLNDHYGHGFYVIRDFAFKHYCNIGMIPRGHVMIKVECIDMFTGFELEDKNEN